MPTPIYVKILLWACYLVSLYFAIFWFLVLMDNEPKPKIKRLKKYPLVSIVIPSYNEEKNLQATLSSVLALKYSRKKIEIIIVNDGSTDNTRKIAENLIAENKNFNIKLINKKNEGKGAALNNGLAIAKGEFFICLDADSRVTKDALQKILPHFTNENIAVVLPLLKVQNPKNLWQKMQWIEYIVNMFYKRLMGRLDCVHVAPGPFSVYRTDVLRKVGGFDEKNLTEDLEIIFRMQSRDYRIIQLLDAEVFTIAPNSFRELYKQRNRWFKGAVLNALRYRSMLFNKRYGDFGYMQIPTILVSGLIAITLISSWLYYGLKPYFKAIYNSIFIDFDFYTLIKTFKLDFSVLDINYMVALVGTITLVISVFVLIKSHKETNESVKKHGTIPMLSYLFFYFLVIGFIWMGIMLDFMRGKKQKW